MRQITTLFMVITLAHGGFAGAADPSPEALKERVVATPAGAFVEVRFHDKGKMAGRMGEVSGGSFRLQRAAGNRIEWVDIAFDNVKSVKAGRPRVAPEDRPTAAAQALTVPPGGGLRMELLTKQKIRGRLVDLSQDSVAVQIASGEGIEVRSIPFASIKSLEPTEKKGMTVATKITIGVLVGLGVLAGAGLIFAAAVAGN